MSNVSVEELATGERKFLHDIANHIVVAQGMSSIVLKTMKDNKPMTEKEIERLQKALDAINEMTNKLKARREILHSISHVG